MGIEVLVNRFELSIGHDGGTPEKEAAALERDDGGYLNLELANALIDLSLINPQAFDAVAELVYTLTDGWETGKA